MAQQFSVEIRGYNGESLEREDFETAVAYLNAHGYTYIPQSQVWTNDLKAVLDQRQRGDSIVSMLRERNIEVCRLGYIDVRPFYEVR